MDYKNFWEKLTKFNNVLIGIHTHPDGDCIGSALAVKAALSSLNIKSTIYSQDKIPDFCSFLKTDEITDRLTGKNFQVLLLIDVNSTERAKISECKIPKNIFIIDHHERESKEFTEEIVIPGASSTSEIIYNLLTENHIEITEEIAQNLLTGLICDTGGFRHSNTSKEALMIGSKLTEAGANPSYITQKYFNEKSLSVIKMTGYVIDRMEAFDNGKILIAPLDYEYIKKQNLTEIDSDTVNLLVQSVKGVEISAFIRETDVNKIRVSLRSPGIYDCNKIAMKFDGGGHINAAGCTIKKSLEEAKKDLLEAILQSNL